MHWILLGYYDYWVLGQIDVVGTRRYVQMISISYHRGQYYQMVNNLNNRNNSFTAFYMRNGIGRNNRGNNG